MRRPLILASVSTGAAAVLLAAGCGGSGGTQGVASVPSTTPTTTQSAQPGLVAFSECMRSNGLPNFPDPQNFDGGNLKLTIHQFGGRAPGSPQFQAAMSACSHLLPTDGGAAPQQTPQQLARQGANGLSFAKCMRSHGVTRFPDPNAQAQLTVEMVQAQGIDIHSPTVLRIIEKCLPASHGGLTLAKVRESLQNAGG